MGLFVDFVEKGGCKMIWEEMSYNRYSENERVSDPSIDCWSPLIYENLVKSGLVHEFK